MASGKTDNLLKAILAEGKDPNTGEYLSPAERKAMFKRVKISGSKVFGRGGGGGNVRGGSRGSLPGAGGGALALRNPQADAMEDIANKLDNIFVLIKRDADQERKQKAVEQEAQRKAREKLLRGSAETRLESANQKKKEKKTSDAKKGIKMQIPFLESLAKFLMIYVGGWATDKFIKMYQGALDNNITELTKYRDILINQLGKLFAPVANIAGGFAAWIVKTVARITEFAGKIGKRVFTKLFTAVRGAAVGMLNRLKKIVKQPLKTLLNKAGNLANTVKQGAIKGLDNLTKPMVGLRKFLGGASEKGFKFLSGLTEKSVSAISKVNPLKWGEKISKSLFSTLGKGMGVLGKGLMKFLKGPGIGAAISGFLTVRERLGAGQPPTQAIIAGVLQGLTSGATAGIVASALGAAIPGLGFPIGLLAGGVLGDMAGKLIVGPIDEWFAKNYKTNEFDTKLFPEWASNQNDTIRAALALDTRDANANAPMSGAGTGNQSRLSPGGAVKNADVITPQRKPRVNPPTMPPGSAAAAQPSVQTVPNKQQITGLPAINPTNEMNPYLAFSYSVYNVLV